MIKEIVNQKPNNRSDNEQSKIHGKKFYWRIVIVTISVIVVSLIVYGLCSKKSSQPIDQQTYPVLESQDTGSSVHLVNSQMQTDVKIFLLLCCVLLIINVIILLILIINNKKSKKAVSKKKQLQDLHKSIGGWIDELILIKETTRTLENANWNSVMFQLGEIAQRLGKLIKELTTEKDKIKE